MASIDISGGTPTVYTPKINTFGAYAVTRASAGVYHLTLANYNPQKCSVIPSPVQIVSGWADHVWAEVYATEIRLTARDAGVLSDNVAGLHVHVRQFG